MPNGWEAVSAQFIERRRQSRIGAETIRKWAEGLPREAKVLDLGCGSGTPVSTMLADLGFSVHGIDASPSLVAEFHRRLPDAPVVCEAVETSPFFNLQFDAVVAIGLLFLLPEAAQKAVIGKAGAAVKTGGSFLFTAPRQRCEWKDMMTGQRSISLGARDYEEELERAGFKLHATHIDEGENHYFDARKNETRGSSGH